MKTRLFKKKLNKIKLIVIIVLKKLFINYINFQSSIDFFFVVKIIISNRVFFRRLFNVFRNDFNYYYIFTNIKLNFE